MIQGTRVAVASGALALLAAVACGPADRASVPESEVEAFLDRYLDAMAARDTAALRRMYAEDDRFVWIEDGAVRYRSVGDVFAGLASLPADASLETDLRGLDVVPLSSDGAYAWASFTTTVGQGAEAYSFEGVLSFALERSSDRWHIVGGHSSSSPPGGGTGER